MAELDAPPDDPLAARALQAMAERRYADAVAAADEAIAGLLHDGLSVDDFVRLSLRGAPAEALLRYERGALARVGRLHLPLTVRWEALRRAGRTEQARQMRAACLHHFKDRASVWATAGNQAIDEGDLPLAESLFDRCLKLAPHWPAALAGKAVVLESRKDWAGALPYRKRVVETTRALEGDDAASLHRVIRYAAALGRLQRWTEAAPLFRRCIAAGAFEHVPYERAALLHVFSGPLRAPAVLAAAYACVPAAFVDASREVREALRQAGELGQALQALQTREDLPPSERLMLAGMVAWLAGDLTRAYALLDEAEVHAPGVLAVQHLLWRCARELGMPELPSIERFARGAAAAVLARGRRCEPAGDRDALHARALLAALGACDAPRPAAEDVALAAAPLPAGGPALAHAVRARVAVAVAVEPRALRDPAS